MLQLLKSDSDFRSRLSGVCGAENESVAVNIEDMQSRPWVARTCSYSYRTVMLVIESNFISAVSLTLSINQPNEKHVYNGSQSTESLCSIHKDVDRLTSQRFQLSQPNPKLYSVLRHFYDLISVLNKTCY